MDRRTITVKVIYDISQFSKNEIVPKEIVEENVNEKMMEIFGWDEGFKKLEVDINDE